MTDQLKSRSGIPATTSGSIPAGMASASVAPAPPRQSILDRPLAKTRGEVSLSVFALLMSEIVQYEQNRVDSVADLSKK
jgi:hypothetical protein